MVNSTLSLIPLTSNNRRRITEPQGGKRAVPERTKQVRANGHESLLVHESEVEPSSGGAETEESSKGVWYAEEPD
jgi:hypothetical protein